MSPLRVDFTFRLKHPIAHVAAIGLVPLDADTSQESKPVKQVEGVRLDRERAAIRCEQLQQVIPHWLDRSAVTADKHVRKLLAMRTYNAVVAYPGPHARGGASVPAYAR